jgi:peptidoglycan hydrolase CwlO-like protein
MVTERAIMLRDKYNAMIEKKMISIGDIDDLMAQVDKVLQNLKSAEESRDKWKAKYKLRNDDAKDYAKEITRLQREFKNG